MYIVHEMISLLWFQDLEVYITSYKGMAKLHSLMFIADHCPPLQQEALKMALVHVLTTYNTQIYQNIHKKLVDAITRYSVVTGRSTLVIDSTKLWH